MHHAIPRLLQPKPGQRTNRFFENFPGPQQSVSLSVTGINWLRDAKRNCAMAGSGVQGGARKGEERKHREKQHAAHSEKVHLPEPFCKNLGRQEEIYKAKRFLKISKSP